MRFSIEIMSSHGRNCPYCNVKMIVPPINHKVKFKNIINASTFPTRDHIIPKSVMPGQGYIIVCRKCNHEKANKTLMDWFDVLKTNNDPRVEYVESFMKNNIHFKRIVKEHNENML